jgi:hypothetical protein
MNFQQLAILPEHKSAPPASGAHRLYSWITLTWIFIGLGIFLRLFHFFDNRSLWIDEVYLATSLISMDFLELASPPLAYEQKAPIGFLWMVKLCVMAFGNGEMALRLFPLACGVASLLLFKPVAHYFLRPMGVAVAIGIMALAPPLVYHAVEVKQYGSELLATVLVLFLYTRYHGKWEMRQLLWWGIWGAMVVWFSYAVIFVLAGTAFAVCLIYLLEREWKKLFYAMIPFTMWAISFVVNYFLFTYKHTDSEWLTHWFRVRDAFMPLPPASLADLKWFFQAGYYMLDYPLGLLWNFGMSTGSKALDIALKMPLLPALFLAVGWMSFYRTDRTTFLLLLFPLLLTLLASGIEAYPFFERLLVFLAPLLILIMARGTRVVAVFFLRGFGGTYIVAGLILLGPMYSSAREVYNTELFGGRKHWHVREALLYINERVKEGDAVYISWNALPEYRFYKDAHLLHFKAIEGKDVRQKSENVPEYFHYLSPDLEAVTKHKRAWVVVNKVMGANIGEVESPTDLFANEIRDGKRLVQKLSESGKLQDAYISPDTDVYLFEFK